jgi:predicted nuclease of predicted toxin-antitoxin system
MKLQLLLDQGLPRSTVAHLAALGIFAEHVGDLGMAAATDQMILDEAQRKQARVVTLDADFHALLALSGAKEPSVIRIRIEGLKGDRLAQLLAQVTGLAAAELAAGAAVSVTLRGIRIRLLPIR